MHCAIIDSLDELDASRPSQAAGQVRLGAYAPPRSSSLTWTSVGWSPSPGARQPRPWPRWEFHAGVLAIRIWRGIAARHDSSPGALGPSPFTSPGRRPSFWPRFHQVPPGLPHVPRSARIQTSRLIGSAPLRSLARRITIPGTEGHARRPCHSGSRRRRAPVLDGRQPRTD